MPTLPPPATATAWTTCCEPGHRWRIGNRQGCAPVRPRRGPVAASSETRTEEELRRLQSDLEDVEHEVLSLYGRLHAVLTPDDTGDANTDGPQVLESPLVEALKHQRRTAVRVLRHLGDLKARLEV